MAITAKSILQRVVMQLVDETSIRWTVTELIRYLNDAQREVIVYRPDATATHQTIQLSAGARQTMPGNAYKLLEVYRNIGGSTVRLIDQNLLDAQVPDWYNGAQSTTIKHYMYDTRDIGVFYVYPPAAVGAQIETLIAAKPTEFAEVNNLDSVTGVISVNELFANALVDYVLYRAAAKDSEYANNATRAQAFYSAFQNAVTVEASATAVSSPKK